MSITPERLVEAASNGHPPVVVEAGAHKGEDTLRLAALCEHVHAFEPIPELYQALEQATAGCENVSAYRYALSNASRTTRMWRSSGGDTQNSSLRKPKDHLRIYPQIAFEGRVSVKVTSLDAWAKDNDIDHVDGLWLDLQGEELKALLGAKTLLPKVRALVLEASLSEIYEGIALWPEVRLWLEDQGFRVEEVEPNGPEDINVLAVRP